jgi:hypothetical protein
MKILIYSRKGIFNWANSFKYFLNTKDVNSEIITELTFEGDILLGKLFNQKLNNDLITDCIFNESQIIDIIKRCRLLRSLELETAKKMVIIYTNLLVELFDEKKITHFISVRVDNYFLDIVYRLSILKSFKFIGLWKNAILKNKIFFTAKGEFNFLNNSDKEIVANFISVLKSENFKATSLNGKNRKTIYSSFQIYLNSYLRGFILNILRYLHNDFYGYRYLTTPLFVKDYKIRYRDIFSHLLYTKKWQNILTDPTIDNKLFIGLQVNPEATIDYYVENLDLINIESVINTILEESTNKGLTIFIKDHPNMLGKRNYYFLKNIRNKHNVFLIPSYIDSNYIINYVNAVFTWSGTIGIQAAIRGKCSIIVNAPYFLKNYYYKISSYNDLKNIFSIVNNHKVRKLSNEELTTLAKNVTDGLIDGSLNFKEKNTKNLHATFENIFIFLNA